MIPFALSLSKRERPIRASTSSARTDIFSLMKFAALALAVFALPFAAHADPVADFYAGQTITFHVGAGAGATYALYAHLLADHMPRHIPGQPAMIVNMAGGQSGGVIAANFLHNAAPKNGLTIGRRSRRSSSTRCCGRRARSSAP